MWSRLLCHENPNPKPQELKICNSKPKILEINSNSSIRKTQKVTFELKNLNQKPHEIKICHSKPKILKPNIKRSIWQTQNKAFEWKNQNPKPQELKRFNRPPALYRLRVKAHTATPVWAFLFSALRARSAKCGVLFARAPVHRSVWRPVSRAPPRRRATRRRARAPPSLSAIWEGETVLTGRPEASGKETRRTARRDAAPSRAIAEGDLRS
jgi:hypothetical protein